MSEDRGVNCGGWLKCPHCGSAAIRSSYIRDGQRVGCSNCGASVQAFEPDALGKATALWNTRTDPDHIAAIRLAREALEPFAKAAMGVATFDADFPMDGAALRASFDWYDKVQAEPLKRHSVRRADLEHAANALTRLDTILGETDRDQ